MRGLVFATCVAALPLAAEQAASPFAGIIRDTIRPCWPTDPVYDDFQVVLTVGIRLGPDAEQLEPLSLIATNAEPIISQRGLRHISFALSACQKELFDALPWARYAEWRDTVVTFGAEIPEG